LSFTFDKNKCPPNLPPKSCKSIFPRNSDTHLNEDKNEMINDSFSGSIQQKCDGRSVEYWRFIGPHDWPSATLTVLNTSDCAMTVRADTNGKGTSDFYLFTITENGQSRSISLPSIANLEVICSGDGKLGTGRFYMTIHYLKKI
jgi:hypothetical protein